MCAPPATQACTMIQHLESLSIDPEALAKALQKKFSTSATIMPVPGKHEDRVELQIQGNLLADISDYLAKEYNVGKDFIELIDKTKK
jgi:translation initiation factor 1 (eIF-1/SUI1)